MVNMADKDGFSERQRAILRDLKEDGFVSTTELARRYGVSDMTIRRDAWKLEKRGAARPVHGGLMLPYGTAHVAGFAARAATEHQAKAQIAQACARLVSPKSRLFIDAGTTAYEIVRAPPENFGGTVITHSAPVIQAALQMPNTTTIAVGGELLHDSQAFIGELAIENLANLRAEIAFIGVAGLDENGFYIGRNLELSTKRAIMSAADRVVLVASASKLGRTDLVRLGDFGEVDVLVTDKEPEGRLAVLLRQAEVDVEVVTYVPSGGFPQA